jgi:hypothetical protein
MVRCQVTQFFSYFGVLVEQKRLRRRQLLNFFWVNLMLLGILSSKGLLSQSPLYPRVYRKIVRSLNVHEPP